MDLAPAERASGTPSADGPGPAPSPPVLPADAPTGPRVLVHRLDPDLPLPAYAHPGDAGADLVTRHEVRLGPGQRTLVGTGVALALPAGYAGFVHPRSGLAARHGLTIVNAPGTVDAGYRGEVMVNLLNTDPVREVVLARGERIAQLVVQRVEHVEFVVVDRADDLPASVRGTGGHGSTGTTTIDPPTGTTRPARDHEHDTMSTRR